MKHLLKIFIFSFLIFATFQLFTSNYVFAQSAGDAVGGAIGGAVNPPTSTTGAAGFGSPLATLISEESGFVYQAWRVTRSVINILLIIALMAISFSNITRINIDTYTIKKALPNLVIGIILANASLYLIRFMSDITTVVTYFFVNQGNSTTFADFLGDAVQLIGVNSIKTTLAVTGFLAPLLVFLFALITIVGLLWLAFLLYFRLVAIYLLTILSPLAFVSYGIPGFDKYFKQWWQQFTKWLFIVPAMAAVFWLMLVIGNAGGNNQSVARLLIMYVLFFMALTLPSKMGGAVIDKASKAFMKYTGANAALNASKEYAQLKGQQIGYRLPGVARYNAWRDLQKENAKKDIEQLKKRGRNKVLAGKTGQNLEKLKLLDKEISLNEEAILAEKEVLAGNQSAFLRSESISNRIIRAEYKKKLEEEKKNANDAEEKLEFLNSDKDDIKKLLKATFKATIDQEVVSKEVGRAEGMKKGGQATEYLQPLQAAANWQRLEDTHKELSKQYEEMEDKNSKDAIKLNKDIGDLARAKTEIENSYNAMRQRSEYSAEFGKLTMEQLAAELKDGKSTNARILQGRQRQTAKMFNEGVMSQIEADVKEQTIPEITRELNEFFKDKLKGDKELIKKFLRGDTAALAAAVGNDGKALLSANDIRNGLVIAEKQKQIARSTNDIRHQDLLKSITEINKQYFDSSDPESFNDALVTHATSDNVKDRRKAAGYIMQNVGIYSRQSNNRNQAAYAGDPEPYPGTVNSQRSNTETEDETEGEGNS